MWVPLHPPVSLIVFVLAALGYATGCASTIQTSVGPTLSDRTGVGVEARVALGLGHTFSRPKWARTDAVTVRPAYGRGWTPGRDQESFTVGPEYATFARDSGVGFRLGAGYRREVEADAGHEFVRHGAGLYAAIPFSLDTHANSPVFAVLSGGVSRTTMFSSIGPELSVDHLFAGASGSRAETRGRLAAAVSWDLFGER